MTLLFLFQDFDCIAQSLILYLLQLVHNRITIISTLKLSASTAVLDDSHFLAQVIGWVC